MKKMYLFLVPLLLILLSGCGERMYITINPDMTFSATYECLFSDEGELNSPVIEGMTLNDFLTELGMKKDTVTIDGVEYTRFSVTENNDYDIRKTEGLFTEFTEQRSVMCASTLKSLISEGQDLGQMELDQFIVTYPYLVISSNGDIRADGYTVMYDLNSITGDRLYALFTEEEVGEEVITLSGAKSGKWYNKDVDLDISSNGIITQLTCDDAIAMSNSVSLHEEGKHRVKVVLASGKKANYTIGIDKVAPTVNVKNKTYKKAVTLKFSDKLSGVKSATLNGKAVKSDKKISAKGFYTLKVKDKAGNVKTVKFKIK